MFLTKRQHHICLLSVMMLVLLIQNLPTYAQTMDTILTGLGEREQLEVNEPHSKWFTEEYDSYKTDSKTLNSCFQGKKLDGYFITIVLGTWCPDSRREVPRFYKILDNLVFPPVNVKLIFVDKDKKDPSGTIKNMEITHVPTFIIRDKKGVEIGRIVEEPKKSLEKDLCQIFGFK